MILEIFLFFNKSSYYVFSCILPDWTLPYCVLILLHLLE